MQIMNVFDDYEYFKGSPLQQYQYWLEYMERYPEIKEKCIKDYLLNNYDPKKIALEKVFIYSNNDFDKMKIVANNIEKICQELESKNYDFIDVSELSYNVLIYHGLGNAAGWATKYKDNPTIMIGLEKIIELGWDDDISLRNLLFHEYAHLVHEHLRGQTLEPFNDNHKVWINRLYIEGFAWYLESVFSGYTRRNDWFKECKKKEKLLKSDFVFRLKHNLSCQEFFGDWYKIHGLSDTGYYLGYQYIKSLTALYDIQYIARMPYFQIEDGIIDYLDGNSSLALYNYLG